MQQCHVRASQHTYCHIPGIPHSLAAAHQFPDTLAQFKLCVVTDNCTTVKREADRQWLSQSFHRDRVHVIGLQETRTDPGTRYPQGAYACFCSAAIKGNLGCQIWLHRTAPVANYEDQPITLDTNNVSVLCRYPRLLAVVVTAGRKLFCFLTGHAPIADASTEHKDEWWNLLDQASRKIPRNAIPVWLLDANARFRDGPKATAREASLLGGTQSANMCHTGPRWSTCDLLDYACRPSGKVGLRCLLSRAFGMFGDHWGPSPLFRIFGLRSSTSSSPKAMGSARRPQGATAVLGSQGHGHKGWQGHHLSDYEFMPVCPLVRPS